MGTKNNPGKFDCYANAHPDEPLFVLLARDRHAAEVVRYWASLRAGETARRDVWTETNPKVAEALDCADAMTAWRLAHPDPEAPFEIGDKAILSGDVNAGVVTSVIKNDIAQSGYLVELNGDGQGLGGTGLCTGLIDSSQFKAVPA